MKSKKVVRIEINTAECGNTVVEVIFGVRGRTMEFGSNAGGGVYMRSVWKFTETNRVELGWYEGYGLRHFDGWEVTAPLVHPAETVAQAVEAACMEVAGWDAQEDECCPSPRHFGGSRTRGRFTQAA